MSSLTESRLVEENISNLIDKCLETPYHISVETTYKNYKIEPAFSLGETGLLYKYNMLRIKLNGDNNIPLIVSVGISTNSLCNNLLVINYNLDKIIDKYSEIIFIYSEGKKIEKEFKRILGEMNKDLSVFEMGDMMKKEMASHYGKIIRNILSISDYKEFDYLGVSFSGGIGIFLMKLGLPLRRIILVAPAITEEFINLKREGFLEDNKTKIILGWSTQDKKVPYDPVGLRLISQLEKFYENKEIITVETIIPEDDKYFDDKTHRLQGEILERL